MRTLHAFLVLFWASSLLLSAESESIDQIVRGLISTDSNVRRTAVDTLYRRLDKERTELPRLIPHRANLESYLQKWHGSSSVKVALLLGLLGDKQAVATLRTIRAECAEIERKADPMDDRNSYAPAVRLACLKALFRLEDDEVRKEVRSLLQSTGVKDRVQGIDCVSYARSKAFVAELVALLDDKRDAVNIAPSPATYFLRVCDLAVNTIASITQMKTSFKLQLFPHGERYTDEKIAEVREKALARFPP